MKPMIFFMVVVILSFAGMVVMRESGRRSDGSPAEALVPTSNVRKATISTGDTVKIEDHLSKHKWTVVEFTADW